VLVKNIFLVEGGTCSVGSMQQVAHSQSVKWCSADRMMGSCSEFGYLVQCRRSQGDLVFIGVTFPSLKLTASW